MGVQMDNHEFETTPNHCESTPQDLTATLKFITWQSLYEIEKPFQIFMNIPPDVPDQRTTNLVFSDHAIKIRDVRHYPKPCSIDERGFIYRKHRTEVPVEGFRNRETVEKSYLPEMEELLKKELGPETVDRVFFFDWRLRKNAPEIEGDVIDMNNLTTWLRPAMHVHIDQSPSAVLRRIQLQLPDEAEFLLQGRVRVINIWRPLIPCVSDYPLTLCSGITSSMNQLIECDHIRRHYMGSTMYLQYDEKGTQEFWYMSKQSMEDVVIFKNFDSEDDAGATFAPHASFRHPALREGDENVQRRESIEVRALVFTYSKEDQS